MAATTPLLSLMELSTCSLAAHVEKAHSDLISVEPRFGNVLSLRVKPGRKMAVVRGVLHGCESRALPAATSPLISGIPSNAAVAIGADGAVFVVANDEHSPVITHLRASDLQVVWQDRVQRDRYAISPVRRFHLFFLDEGRADLILYLWAGDQSKAPFTFVGEWWIRPSVTRALGTVQRLDIAPMPNFANPNLPRYVLGHGAAPESLIWGSLTDVHLMQREYGDCLTVFPASGDATWPVLNRGLLQGYYDQKLSATGHSVVQCGAGSALYADRYQETLGGRPCTSGVVIRRLYVANERGLVALWRPSLRALTEAAGKGPVDEEQRGRLSLTLHSLSWGEGESDGVLHIVWRVALNVMLTAVLVHDAVDQNGGVRLTRMPRDPLLLPAVFRERARALALLRINTSTNGDTETAGCGAMWSTLPLELFELVLDCFYAGAEQGIPRELATLRTDA